MPANVLSRSPDVSETLAYHICELESRISNLKYLLRFPQVDEAQKERLQRVLEATEAELIEAGEKWLRSSPTEPLSYGPHHDCSH
jgi:hypothetical protein